MRVLQSACGIVTLLALLASCSGETSMSNPGVEVWATSDGVRVNPETGKYLEDRADIHKDYPTGTTARPTRCGTPARRW